MAKRALILIIASVLIAGSAVPAFCDDPGPKLDGPLTKLGRGLANILTFPLEVPEQISRTGTSDGPFAAGTVGLLKGLGSAAGRALVGIYETASFMVPYPRDYQPILKDPEYFLEGHTY